jgi:hypothetical protein
VTQDVEVLDLAAPVTTSSADEAWHSGPVDVTFSATDADDPQPSISTHYRIGSDPTELTYSGTPVRISAEGATALEFWSHDAGGNTETPHKSAEVRIDTQAPSTKSGARDVYVTSASIVLGAGDADSGVASTHWRIDDGAWNTGTLATTGVPGSHTLEFYSVDNAGNVEDPPKSASFTVEAYGTITGTLTSASVPLNRVVVTVFDATTHAFVKGVYTDAAGIYSAAKLPAGSYHLRFTGTTPASLAQYYSNARDISSAATLSIGAEATVIASSDLAPPPVVNGTIAGTITAASVPQNRVVVAAFDAVTHAHIKGVFSDALGAYSIANLPPGTYHLRFTGTTPASLTQYYDHIGAISSATTLTVAPGVTTAVSSDLAAPASSAGAISGTITAGGVGQNRIVVTAFDATTHVSVKGVFTDAAGLYTLAGMAPGSYHLRFTGTTPASLSQYYDRKGTISTATTVTVGSGATTPASSDLAP